MRSPSGLRRGPWRRRGRECSVDRRHAVAPRPAGHFGNSARWLSAASRPRKDHRRAGQAITFLELSGTVPGRLGLFTFLSKQLPLPSRAGHPRDLHRAVSLRAFARLDSSSPADIGPSRRAGAETGRQKTSTRSRRRLTAESSSGAAVPPQGAVGDNTRYVAHPVSGLSAGFPCGNLFAVGRPQQDFPVHAPPHRSQIARPCSPRDDKVRMGEACARQI